MLRKFLITIVCLALANAEYTGHLGNLGKTQSKEVPLDFPGNFCSDSFCNNRCVAILPTKNDKG